jgi:hypothetical protein
LWELVVWRCGLLFASVPLVHYPAKYEFFGECILLICRFLYDFGVSRSDEFQRRC